MEEGSGPIHFHDKSQNDSDGDKGGFGVGVGVVQEKKSENHDTRRKDAENIEEMIMSIDIEKKVVEKNVDDHKGGFGVGVVDEERKGENQDKRKDAGNIEENIDIENDVEVLEIQVDKEEKQLKTQNQHQNVNHPNYLKSDEEKHYLTEVGSKRLLLKVMVANTFKIEFITLLTIVADTINFLFRNPMNLTSRRTEKKAMVKETSDFLVVFQKLSSFGKFFVIEGFVVSSVIFPRTIPKYLAYGIIHILELNKASIEFGKDPNTGKVQRKYIPMIQAQRENKYTWLYEGKVKSKSQQNNGNAQGQGQAQRSLDQIQGQIHGNAQGRGARNGNEILQLQLQQKDIEIPNLIPSRNNLRKIETKSSYSQTDLITKEVKDAGSQTDFFEMKDQSIQSELFIEELELDYSAVYKDPKPAEYIFSEGKQRKIKFSQKLNDDEVKALKERILKEINTQKLKNESLENYSEDLLRPLFGLFLRHKRQLSYSSWLVDPFILENNILTNLCLDWELNELKENLVRRYVIIPFRYLSDQKWNLLLIQNNNGFYKSYSFIYKKVNDIVEENQLHVKETAERILTFLGKHEINLTGRENKQGIQFVTVNETFEFNKTRDILSIIHLIIYISEFSILFHGPEDKGLTVSLEDIQRIERDLKSFIDDHGMFL